MLVLAHLPFGLLNFLLLEFGGYTLVSALSSIKKEAQCQPWTTSTVSLSIGNPGIDRWQEKDTAKTV